MKTLYSHSFPVDKKWCVLIFSDQGLVRLDFNLDTPQDRLREVEYQYPELQTAEVLPAWVLEAEQKLTVYLQGTSVNLADIPLDIAHLPLFHQKVYAALLQTEPGTTVTYGELAALADNPKAARAVGSAMARNPLPLIIACHRVVQSNGALGNYSGMGGIVTKQWLLDMERSVTSKQ